MTITLGKIVFVGWSFLMILLLAVIIVSRQTTADVGAASFIVRSPLHERSSVLQIMQSGHRVRTAPSPRCYLGGFPIASQSFPKQMSSTGSPVVSYMVGSEESVSPTESDEARRLREEADRLRGEIADFERTKDEVKRLEQEDKERFEAVKLDERMRYSAEVPILKEDGSTVMERVDFPPRVSGGKSRIEACQAPLPLGIILGEHEDIPGTIRVDEVSSGGNGDVAGVRVGDLLRACTACRVTMETPTWQLIAGGIGRPKTKRFMYSTDGWPFEEVMDAVASNRMDPEGRPVWLVIERVES